MSTDHVEKTDYATHQRTEAERRREFERNQAIREAIDAGHRSLAAGRQEYITELVYGSPRSPLDDSLVKALLPRDFASLQQLDSEHRDTDQWDWHAVLAVWSDIHDTNHVDVEPTKPVLRRTFDSLTAVAQTQGIVPSDVTRTVPVVGHELQLGTQDVKPGSGTPDVHRIVDRQGSPPVSAIQGTRGYGKSTALARCVLDRYYAGKKIVDVSDLSKLENGFYDLPQSQSELRRVLREMDMAEDVLDAQGYERPDIEILVPLSDELDGREIPIREDGSTVVRPFTIPASEIPRKTLNLMLSHLTDVQQTYLDRAYQQIESENSGWSLRDLADEVLATDAQDRVKRSLYNTLASLQNAGFIRDSDCEHAIDWGRIFTDEDTITVFSQSLLEDTAHKFMVLSYLTHSIYMERIGRNDLPPMVAAFREAHRVAPNSATASEDERERELQSGSTAAFQELCAEGRHQSVEVICDTQQIMGQVNKRAREHIERVISFRSQFSTIKDVFADMVGLDDDRYHYMRKIARRFKPGEAAVIGKTGMDSSLEMTIQWAPPFCHHLDASTGVNGWRTRAHVSQGWAEVPSEFLKPVPWDCGLPDDLAFEELDLGEGDDNPVERCIKQCFTEEDGSELKSDTAQDVVRHYANENGFDPPSPTSIGSRLSNAFSYEVQQRRDEHGENARFYVGLGLTPTGHRYRSGGSPDADCITTD